MIGPDGKPIQQLAPNGQQSPVPIQQQQSNNLPESEDFSLAFRAMERLMEAT